MDMKRSFRLRAALAIVTAEQERDSSLDAPVMMWGLYPFLRRHKSKRVQPQADAFVPPVHDSATEACANFVVVQVAECEICDVCEQVESSRRVAVEEVIGRPERHGQ